MSLKNRLISQERKDYKMTLRNMGIALTPKEYVNNLKLHRVTKGEEGKVKYFLQGKSGSMASLSYGPSGIQDEMSIRILYPESLIRIMKRKKGTWTGRTEVRGSRYVMDNMSFTAFEEKVKKVIEQTYGEINDIF